MTDLTITDEDVAALGPPSIVDPGRFGTAIDYDRALRAIAKMRGERDEALREASFYENLAAPEIGGGARHWYKDENTRLRSLLERAGEAIKPLARVAEVRPLETRQNGDVIYIVASITGEARLLFSDCDKASSLHVEIEKEIGSTQEFPTASGEKDKCDICEVEFTPDDDCLIDVSLGVVHAACCGPERESYVKDIDTGEPLGPGDPIPAPFKYSSLGQVKS